MVNYDVGEKGSSKTTSFWDQVSHITDTGDQLIPITASDPLTLAPFVYLTHDIPTVSAPS
jgi:hypothetical protein